MNAKIKKKRDEFNALKSELDEMKKQGEDYQEKRQALLNDLKDLDEGYQALGLQEKYQEKATEATKVNDELLELLNEL